MLLPLVFLTSIVLGTHFDEITQDVMKQKLTDFLGLDNLQMPVLARAYREVYAEKAKAYIKAIRIIKNGEGSAEAAIFPHGSVAVRGDPVTLVL